MRRKIRILTAALLSASLLTGTAYASTAKIAGQKWIDSDIAGAVTADTPADVKDDFSIAVNKDWTLGVKMRESQAEASSTSELEDSVREQILNQIRNGGSTSHEAALVKQLYSDTADMEKRNADGIEPARKYVDEVLAIDSMDKLNAYVTDTSDPFAPRLYFGSVMADIKDSSRYAVYTGGISLSLGDADEYRNMTTLGKRSKAAQKAAFVAYYGLFGMSEKEAGERYDAMISLETKLSSVTYGASVKKEADYFQKIYNPVQLSDLVAVSPNYPVADALKMYTDRGINNFIDVNPAYLPKLNELYTTENLEAIKDLMLYRVMLQTISYLDQRCVDISDQLASAISQSSYKSDPEEDAYSACSGSLDWAVGKMFVEGCVNSKTKTDVEKIISNTVATYRARLSSNTWLSDTTKEKAIEKLDSLTVRAAYPDDWSKYTYDGLNFTSREDGGTLIDDIGKTVIYSFQKSVDKATKPVDRERWLETPQTVNAGYQMTDNSINIPAGILGGDFYNPDASEAVNMGGIGMVIGHEISHGFDPKGSQFDKDGNMTDWWTEEDRTAFNERAQKVIDYFSTFEPIQGIHVDGELTKGESVADIGGMMCMMEIAKTKENFDYETFFRQYAKIWKTKTSAGDEEVNVRTDPHPPAYLRTNVTVQQFQEFYDTFGIKEGDNMYLAPEKRLSVW